MRMKPINRRDCLLLGARGTALAAGIGSVASASARTTGIPALGERVEWPAIRLLGGVEAEHPAPGGAATIVVFFATTCPFCARHNDHVQKLLERSRGLPLRVLAVAHDRQEAYVRSYLQRRGLGFDVSLDHVPMRAALTPLKGIPVTCAIDRQQRLREVIRGEMFEADVLGLAKWCGPA
jgi:thiol-disulfide isomerase/thioredoxin